MSKVAANYFAVRAAVEFKEKGLLVGVIHPGYVACLPFSSPFHSSFTCSLTDAKPKLKKQMGQDEHGTGVCGRGRLYGGDSRGCADQC